jgi:SAM-dependent methyltransferase
MTESIHYDPLKALLGRFVSRNVLLRRLFYTALGMLFLRQWHVRAQLNNIVRKKKDVRAILDAGSGYGQYTYLMGKLFPQAKITAVDVKDEQIEDGNWFSQRVGQKNAIFEIGDLTIYSKPDTFDLALSVDVMEHILEDESVYRNVFASLRKGGLFVITTPAIEKAPPPGVVDSVIGEHVREGYTAQEFREKMTRAGFVVDLMKYAYGPFWGRIAWMILQRIPMILLSVSKAFIILVIPWIIVLYLPAAFCMLTDVMSSNRKGGGWVLVARKP